MAAEKQRLEVGNVDSLDEIIEPAYTAEDLRRAAALARKMGHDEAIEAAREREATITEELHDFAQAEYARGATEQAAMLEALVKMQEAQEHASYRDGLAEGDLRCGARSGITHEGEELRCNKPVDHPLGRLDRHKSVKYDATGEVVAAVVWPGALK